MPPNSVSTTRVVECIAFRATGTRSRRIGSWQRAAVAALAMLASFAAPSRATAVTVFLTGDFIQLPIDNDTRPGRFMAEGDTSGAKYNPIGTGGGSGQDFWIFGTPVYNYTIAIDGSSLRSNGGGWAVPPTVNDTSSGTVNSATISGQPFTGLTFTRAVIFGDGDQFVTITDTLTNSSGAPFTQVATLDNTDPDQDEPSGTFETNNDVVTVQVANDLVVATGPVTQLSLGFGSLNSARVVDSSGFSNTDPYSIIAFPSDPDGSAGDIGLNIAVDYGTLADGETRTVTWYMVFGSDKAAAIATYAQATGCGDGVVSASEECDDGGIAPGDGCNAACRVEPCYTCSGTPSLCTTLPDGTTCDDALFCNGSDTCSGGTCGVHTGDPCPAGGDCTGCNEATNSCTPPAGTACTDDGNLCTADVCDASGMCTHPDNNFVPCDDGLFCTGPDFCFAGSCLIHDGDPCFFNECTRVCDETANACGPDMAGTSCTDDGDVCTEDECDGAGTCGHPPVPGGQPCPDDGNECTLDRCDGGGGCAHPPVMSGTPCTSDGNTCTVDQCNGAGACGNPALPDGTACNDANACTQVDQCDGGSCIGSNPVVCTAPLCHLPGICDPSTGACTNCPAGYTQGNGGCQKIYAIAVSQLNDLASFCDGTGINRYNGCFTASIGFHWADTADAAVGAVTRIDVALNTGLDCGGSPHTVTLNSANIGVYTATAAGSCQCEPPHVTRLLSNVTTSTYVKGGQNAVSISTGNNCVGLSRDSNGAYATVTVTYADLGLPLALRNGCRHPARSKFRYRGNASDAKDKMGWKWSHGDETMPSEFGEPRVSTEYELCVFAETSEAPTLLLGARVPASSTLWRASGGAGFKYSDGAATADGMKKIVLRGGEVGSSKLLVKGEGVQLGDPALPLSVTLSGIRVQLTNQSNGVCWESEFPLSTITADDRNIKATVR